MVSLEIDFAPEGYKLVARNINIRFFQNILKVTHLQQIEALNKKIYFLKNSQN